MKPLHLRARNLRTWRDLDVRVPEGIAAVVGPNGAGKSTLVSAIDLALFGKGAEMKRALSRGAGEELVEIELVFEHGAGVYRVTRGYNIRSGGKPELRLERSYGELGSDWRAIGGTTVSETQEKLEDLLGLSRQTFRASSYLAQDDGAAFTMAEPRERKAILLDALGVRVWDRLLERARELRKEAEREASQTLSKVETLEAEQTLAEGAKAAQAAARLARDAFSTAISDLEEGLAARRRELEDAIALEAQAVARREAMKNALERLEEMTKKEDDLSKRIAELASAADQELALAALAKTRPHLETLVAIRRRGAEVRAQMQRLEGLAERHRDLEGHETRKADDASAAVAQAELELAELVEKETEARCPTCGQELRDPARTAMMISERRRGKESAERSRDAALELAVSEAKLGHQAEVEAAKMKDELDELLKSHVAAAELLPDTLKTIDPAVAREKAEAAELELASLRGKLAHRDAMTDELAEVRKALPDLRQRADEATAAARELVARTPLAEHRRKVEEGELVLRGKRAQLEEAEAGLGRATERVEALAEKAAELEALRPMLESEKADVELFKLAERAFGRDGVPALILETAAIPQLEAEANRIVRELGREYRFELRTQRATQAGDVKEALDIVVMTESGAALYEDFSGGERARIDLALRIALARLLASRRGTDVRLLAIDEPSFLDVEGFEKLAGVLRGLAGEFESILVVSHVEELRDAFDSALVVEGGADSGEPSRLAGSVTDLQEVTT